MNHQELLTELKALLDKDYREEYLRSLVQIGVSSQVRALRGDKSQKEFAALVGMPQSVISERLENPHYAGLNTSTLVSVANALQVGLLVRFVSFPELLQRTEDASEEALRVATISDSVSSLSASRTTHVVRLRDWSGEKFRRTANPPTEKIITYDASSAGERVRIGRPSTTGGFIWTPAPARQASPLFLSSGALNTANITPTIVKSALRPSM